MTVNDFMMDMEARAFAAHAESNPRLKELAGKDCFNNLTEAEQDELFQLFEEAEASFYEDDDAYADSFLPPYDDPIWEEDPVDLFGPWWE